MVKKNTNPDQRGKQVNPSVGVDDGHFQKVLDDEVRALKNACRGKINL